MIYNSSLARNRNWIEAMLFLIQIASILLRYGSVGKKTDSTTYWIRIVQRYIRLVGTSNDKPLAVYKHEGTGFPRYLTSTIVTIEMRILAQSVHGITKKEDLQRFSCHSLRVGACNIYFASGVSPEVIKRVLRWESDAWRQYVRDLRCTAVQVVTSMNTADNLPIM